MYEIVLHSASLRDNSQYVKQVYCTQNPDFKTQEWSLIWVYDLPEEGVIVH